MGKETSLRTLLLAAAGLVLAAAPLHAQPNVDTGSILTLTAQSVGQAVSSDQSNSVSSGVKCVANLTSVSGGSVIIAVQGRDRGSGQYINLLGSPAINGAGVYTLTVGRALGPTLIPSPWVANDVVPVAWRVTATVLGQSTASVTGTVGCSLI